MWEKIAPMSTTPGQEMPPPPWTPPAMPVTPIPIQARSREEGSTKVVIKVVIKQDTKLGTRGLIHLQKQ